MPTRKTCFVLPEPFGRVQRRLLHAVEIRFLPLSSRLISATSAPGRSASSFVPPFFVSQAVNFARSSTWFGGAAPRGRKARVS